MKVIALNAVIYGSTGKIMLQISRVARNGGMKSYTLSSKRASHGKLPEYHIFLDSGLEYHISQTLGFLTGAETLFPFATRKLIKCLKRIKPDIIHLHILHSYYINLNELFRYIKKHNIRTVWTLHDCWAITARCPHFQLSGCDKWKIGCENCPYPKKAYPASLLFDNSKKMYKLKKKWFTNVPNMTIVTPSQWLADLVKESFLKNYPVKVINNGIDLEIFKPTESDFRKKHGAEDKFILLGVAAGWGERKGLDVFLELARRLDDRFKIVLVGTNDNVDKQLPSNIISIHRTQNQIELAGIYSAADLFVNPTREDTYPTVNMESVACGTPVVTFNTGGSSEMLDETCGAVVPKDDIDALYNEIMRIYEKKPFTEKACLKKAKSYDMNDKFEEYIKLYEQSVD